MLIAIDTSTGTAGLAIVKDGAVIAELNWRCGQNQTVQLLPNLSYLLERNELDIKSAGCVIVARGPGSYNGLRVGISTAKGLAFSLGIPIIGISTLEAEAYQYSDTGLPVCPVFNAGREEIATATYRKKGGKWQQVAEERLTTIEALCAEITEKTLFCGEYLVSVSGEIKDRLKGKAVIISPVSGMRRAGYLAELGLKRYQAGNYDDTTTLQPSYFRGPSITKPKNGKR